MGIKKIKNAQPTMLKIVGLFSEELKYFTPTVQKINFKCLNKLTRFSSFSKNIELKYT